MERKKLAPTDQKLKVTTPVPKRVGFSLAMRDYLGKPGQSTKDFLEELKVLSPTDRQWYADQLKRVGYELVPA